MKDLMPVITSNDGRFHDGNPAAGELGTRVTAQYLNNVQDHIRAVEEELKYVLSKAGLNPNDAKTTQVYDAIIAIINANRRSASTTSKGEVQLTDSINMASSVFGASALAVKTAYDKGVEALNVANAKQSPATTLAGYGITDFVSRKLNENDNLNDIKINGLYYIVGTSKATLSKNYPIEGGDGALEVYGNGYFQRFTTFHSRQVFIRRKIDNVWTEWLSIDGLNKADRIGDEIKMKTIDYTKAEGYAYSGFYRPNSAKLGDKGLQNLMIHINHPNYLNNAHARGIAFDYGSADGDRCWDLFTTAFDKDGNYLGYKKIMTELGGQFNGDVSLGYNNKLFTRRISSIANANYALDLNSKQGIFLYNSEDSSDLVAGFRPARIDLVKDVNLGNKMLAFSFDRTNTDLPDSTNIDGIWHDDTTNVFHFQSDSQYKTPGRRGRAKLEAADFMIDDTKSFSNIVSAVSALLAGNLAGLKSIANLLGQSGTTPLGVSYDFTNSDGWWINYGPLYGGLIIQGGNVTTFLLGNNGDLSINYPINFAKTPLTPILSSTAGIVPGGNADSDNGAFIRYTDKTRFIINSPWSNMDSRYYGPLRWVSFGI